MFVGNQEPTGCLRQGPRDGIKTSIQESNTPEAAGRDPGLEEAPWVHNLKDSRGCEKAKQIKTHAA